MREGVRGLFWLAFVFFGKVARGGKDENSGGIGHDGRVGLDGR